MSNVIDMAAALKATSEQYLLRYGERQILKEAMATLRAYAARGQIAPDLNAAVQAWGEQMLVNLEGAALVAENLLGAEPNGA